VKIYITYRKFRIQVESLEYEYIKVISGVTANKVIISILLFFFLFNYFIIIIMILGKSFDRNSYFKPGFWSRLIFIFTVLSNIIKFLLLSV